MKKLVSRISPKFKNLRNAKRKRRISPELWRKYNVFFSTLESIEGELPPFNSAQYDSEADNALYNGIYE